MSFITRFQTVIIFVCIYFLSHLDYSEGAVATHHHSNLNKERVQDGLYGARDSHHYGDDGGHNDEFDHEAIVGSHKEAEEFHQLSPEESKKRLEILIKKMDLNSDQYVDRHELKAWILRSFRRLTEEEGSERFEEVDHNEDNKVTWQEYLKDTYDMTNEGDLRDPFQTPHAEAEDKLIEDDRRMFQAADLNNDGVLSSSEFIVFFSPEEHAHMLPIILEQTLKDKDKDGDGRINFQEFIGDSAENHDKEWLLTEKEKFDSDYDKDGDGMLNGNEILSWVVPSNE